MQREADEASVLLASNHAPAGSAKDSLSSLEDDLSLAGTSMGEDEGKRPGGGLRVEVDLLTD